MLCQLNSVINSMYVASVLLFELISIDSGVLVSGGGNNVTSLSEVHTDIGASGSQQVIKVSSQ